MEQPEVEPGPHEFRPGPERRVEARHRLGAVGIAGAGNAEIVPGQRIGGIAPPRATMRAARLRPTPRLVEADAALVPELRVAGLPLQHPVVQLEGGAQVMAE